MKKPLGAVSAAMIDRALSQWEEFASCGTWDMADAMRTAANNDQPGVAKLEFRGGKYWVMVRRQHGE